MNRMTRGSPYKAASGPASASVKRRSTIRPVSKTICTGQSNCTQATVGNSRVGSERGSVPRDEDRPVGQERAARLGP